MLKRARVGIANALAILAQRIGADPRDPDASRIPYSGRTIAGVLITPDNAVTLPAIWRGLCYLSQTTAVLPWHVMRNGKRGAEIASSHSVDRLLWKRVSPEWSSFQFRETLTHWALRWGNGYAEIEPDQAGRPFVLWPVHPERVEVCRAIENSIDAYGDPIRAGDLYYEVDQDSGADIVLSARHIFHIRGFGEGPVGVNVIQYAAQSLGWAKAAQLFGSSFFGNGANITGVVANKKALSPSGLKLQREEFEQLYKGPKNAHKTAFLDNDADWKAIGVDPTKSQLTETNAALVLDACRWLGVPPHKVMDLSRATFCLPADTLISTSVGPRRIVDVKSGDVVWSRGANDAWQLSRVARSVCSGIDKILKIRTTNRTVRCNAKHPILARRERDIPAHGPGGKNVNGKKVRVEWRTEFVPAGELKAGDAIVTMDSLPDVGVRVAPDGCSLARIASIETEKAEPVYDLCVEDTHNFIADGVVVHNSNIESQAIEVVVDSISPWVKRFEDEADYKLFGPVNRQSFYTKMNMRALMRGDTAARIAYYEGMHKTGAYSPNRILELEDENTIGPDGDIHVMQNQNVTLEQIRKGTALPSTSPVPASEKEPPPADPSIDPPAEEDPGLLNAIDRIGALLEPAHVE